MIFRRYLFTILCIIAFILAGTAIWLVRHCYHKDIGTHTFNGERALRDVVQQISFGPRIPGSPAHTQAIEWIRSEAYSAGWKTEIQTTTRLGHPVKNVIARRNDLSPTIIIAAHYDSRLYADHDPDPAKQYDPVPGANDGASGVAVLLELARTLPVDIVPVWLVFLDAEDNGNIPGWDWILGSRAFVESNPITPEAVIVVDMVGDIDLNIYMERNSDPNLTYEIWLQADKLGYNETFIPILKYKILDDHIPFIEAGIPAVVIIDIDYPYYHTTSDTTDKVSAESLEIVGKILLSWVSQYRQNS